MLTVQLHVTAGVSVDSKHKSKGSGIRQPQEREVETPYRVSSLGSKPALKIRNKEFYYKCS